MTHHARGGGVQRGLSDMSEEEEFDAASATCARRRGSMRPQRQDRGGGVRRGLSDMSEEEEFDAATATSRCCLAYKIPRGCVDGV